MKIDISNYGTMRRSSMLNFESKETLLEVGDAISSQNWPHAVSRSSSWGFEPTNKDVVSNKEATSLKKTERRRENMWMKRDPLHQKNLLFRNDTCWDKYKMK